MSKEPLYYQTGISGIVPSSQTANRKPTISLEVFRKNLQRQIELDIKDNPRFPSKNKLFVFITQFFVSEKKCNDYDIDNISKTILDVLKKTICKDDSQVSVLLASKMIDKQQVKEDFAYVVCKEIKGTTVLKLIKQSFYQNAIIYYQTEVPKNKFKP